MTRFLAWSVLRRGGPTPLRRVERVGQRHGLSRRDRALLRRQVVTVLLRLGTLRALVGAFASRKPSADAAAFLHLGLAQLLFLSRVPEHAAIAETARAAGRALGQSKARRIRELLQVVARARRSGSSGDPTRDLVDSPWHFERPVFHDPRAHPWLWAEEALSMPASVVSRWAKRHGRETALALARRFLGEPELGLRAARGGREALLAELRQAGIAARAGAHPLAIRTPAGTARSVLASAAFVEGRLTVQGEAALRAAELVEARPGETLLDLCAAPGGKTAVLAAAGARVVALDRSASRCTRVVAGLARLVPDARVLAAASSGTSGLRPAALFDGVLVDAPCSNSGVLARRPEARWRMGPAQRTALRGLQSELLEQARTHVLPGGRLVWSTCSLEPEENGQLVRAFLARHPEWALESELESLPALERVDGPPPTGSSVSPGPPGSPGGSLDGGYAARLRLAAGRIG